MIFLNRFSRVLSSFLADFIKKSYYIRKFVLFRTISKTPCILFQIPSQFMFIFFHLLLTRMQITIHWLHICKCQKWRRMSDFSDRSRRDQFISAENLISTINKHPVPSSRSSAENYKFIFFLSSVKLASLIDSDVKLIRVCWGYWSIINQTELLWSIINQTSYCFAFRHIALAQWGADYGRWFPW